MQWTGAVVSALAALLIVVGMISARWWSGSQGVVDWGVGLREVELCPPQSCSSRPLAGLGTEAWTRLGAVAFAIGWVAFLFLASASAAALWARGWARRLGLAAATVSLFALFVGAGFAWTYPGFDGLGAGHAMFAYLGGAALGVGSAGMLIAGGAARRAS